MFSTSLNNQVPKKKISQPDFHNSNSSEACASFDLKYVSKETCFLKIVDHFSGIKIIL
jgi:hypothetical protein